MIDMIASLIVYLIAQVILLTVAVCVGFVLHWCVPGLDIGMAILISMLSSIACAYLFVKAMKARDIGLLEEFFREQAEGDVDDEDEGDSSPDVRLTLAPSSKRRRSRSKKK